MSNKFKDKVYLDFFKSIVKELNKRFPDYNPLTVTDYNEVVRLIESTIKGIPSIKASQIATDYENYRTNVTGYEATIEDMSSRLKEHRKIKEEYNNEKDVKKKPRNHSLWDIMLKEARDSKAKFFNYKGNKYIRKETKAKNNNALLVTYKKAGFWD